MARSTTSSARRRDVYSASPTTEVVSAAVWFRLFKEIASKAGRLPFGVRGRAERKDGGVVTAAKRTIKRSDGLEKFIVTMNATNEHSNNLKKAHEKESYVCRAQS